MSLMSNLMGAIFDINIKHAYMNLEHNKNVKIKWIYFPVMKISCIKVNFCVFHTKIQVWKDSMTQFSFFLVNYSLIFKMYAFWRWFYPKQLFRVYILLGEAFPGNRPHDFAVASDMIYRNCSPIKDISNEFQDMHIMKSWSLWELNPWPCCCQRHALHWFFNRIPVHTFY